MLESLSNIVSEVKNGVVKARNDLDKMLGCKSDKDTAIIDVALTLLYFMLGVTKTIIQGVDYASLEGAYWSTITLGMGIFLICTLILCCVMYYNEWLENKVLNLHRHSYWQEFLHFKLAKSIAMLLIYLEGRLMGVDLGVIFLALAIYGIVSCCTMYNKSKAPN